ncbi:MAG: M20/M25/M40 family metallo-hydrolase [Candidatus Helarchaeota archaeon]
MKTDMSHGDFMYELIDGICKKHGPRPPCSEAEKNAAEDYKNELDKYCDETFLEKFQTYPDLYPQGVVRVCGVIGLFAYFALPFIFPITLLSIILAVLGLTIFYLEIVKLQESIKFLFKKKDSQNVFGKIFPEKQKKVLIIFGGHLDSAMESGLVKHEKHLVGLTFGGIGLIVYFLIIALIKVISQVISLLFALPLLSFTLGIFQWTIFDTIFYVPFVPWLILYLYVIIGWGGKVPVQGANDNLSGSAVSVAIARYLKENRPKNVEVWVGAFGCEECGDRGSKAFVEKYEKENILENAYIIIPESVGAGDLFYIWEKEPLHGIKLHEEVIKKLYQAYKNAKSENEDLTKCVIANAMTASDAGRFAKKGYKATTLEAVVDLKTGKPANWHSVHDIPENLNKKTLQDAVEICLHFINLIDSEFD